jgi:anti-sigma regulatory factor (Ser/Thr protein kinase)
LEESVDVLEISLHILDIVENSVAVGANLVRILVEKDDNRDLLTLTVQDNGSGLAPEDVQRIADPFFTTRTTRRVGMGVALLKQTAEQSNGSFMIESAPGVGTTVRAEFVLSHLDRPPMGNLADTLMTLILGNQDSDFLYRQTSNGRVFEFDTREVKETLDGVPLSHPDVFVFLRENIKSGIAELAPI